MKVAKLLEMSKQMSELSHISVTVQNVTVEYEKELSIDEQNKMNMVADIIRKKLWNPRRLKLQEMMDKAVKE